MSREDIIKGAELNPYTAKLLELKDSNLLSFDKTTKIPFIINEFIVEETLSRTPNSVVKRSRHHSIKKAVVIKQIVIPHGRINENQVKKIDHLKKEIEFLQLLSGSKNVVELYGFCIEPEHLYICLESMDISLKELYLLVHKVYGNFPEELINKIIIKIVDALSECHANSITHRDVKPQNILVNWDGNIKLCDFGVSRILYETSLYTTAGTFPYMSPEYFTTGRTGLKADVWSLGITIIEVLHGKNIIPDGNTFPEITKVIVNLNSLEVIENLPETYSDELKGFIKQCLTIKNENRPTLEELKNLILYKNENQDVSNSFKHDLITTILHNSRSLFERQNINNFHISEAEQIQNMKTIVDIRKAFLNQIIVVKRITYSPNDNQNLLHTIKNNPRMVEIDSQQCGPYFLAQDSFYATLNSAPNLFFIDVDIGELALIEIRANLEANIKDQLKEFTNSIIIQCKSLSNTMAYVKEPNKEPIILDLNTDKDLLDEDEFIETISNKKFSLPLVIRALKSKIVGEFKDGFPLSLNRNGVTFTINKQFDKWKLIDYAAWHDDFLSTRFLSLHDWDLDKANEAGFRTLEIAAEHASVDTLAALLDLQFPISNEKITLTKDKAALLERKGSIS